MDLEPFFLALSLFSLNLLLAAPALAATVTCPSSCSCYTSDEGHSRR